MLRVPPRFQLVVVTAVATATVGTLVTHRPAFAGAARTWTGQELALGCAWGVAVACATWIAFSGALSLAALATGSRNRARFACSVPTPRFMRRIVEASLATSLVVATALPAVAAVAAPRPAPPRALVSPAGDQPVVRTPTPAAARPVPTNPTPTPTTTTTTKKPQAAPPTARPDRVHTVVAGDNLWTIARAELVARGHTPDAATIARYWHAVIERNRPSLRSHDPNLIFPGEVVALPEPG